MKNMKASHVVSSPSTDAYREGWERVFGKTKHLVVAHLDGRISIDGNFLKPDETIQQKLDELDSIYEKYKEIDIDVSFESKIPHIDSDGELDSGIGSSMVGSHNE